MTSQLQAVRRKPEAYPWVTSLLAKKPNKLVAVAMANKAARIAWVVLLISHHTVKSPLVMPLSFFAAVGAIHMAGAAGLIDRSDWFVVSMSLTPWEPFAAAGSGDIQWSSILAAFPEIAACVLVGLFSLTVRISTIETMRKVSADIDAEFRTYGAANILAAPLGAMPGGILFSTSKLIQVAGYRSPMCYIVMAAILLSIVVWGADLSPLLPKPVLGGLLLYLGYTMSLEAVRIVFSQSGLNLFAALLIFLICLNAGFLAGAIFGVLAACLIFAIECSRTGVVRHHITRADVSGGTEWPSELEEALRARGKAIQIFELSGYIFFGSSEKLFDRIRAQVRQQQTPPVRFILLDFTRVSGFDTTAVNTLIRLQSFARQNNIWTIYCALPAEFEAAIVRARLLDQGQNVVHFPSRIESVFWCETQLLQSQGLPVDDAGPSSFSDWMSEELGLEVGRDVLTRYFDKKNFGSGEEVYRQGSPASTIDFIASGSVLLILETPDGPQVIRRATRRTVIGEMGFFRNVERSVSICAEEPLTLYSLTRDAMTELEEEMPDLHAGILAFIVRVLCDRLEMANHEISALR